MDYKVITGSSSTEFVNLLQAAVMQGYSPVGDLHNSRAGNLIISVQKLPYTTTYQIAVVIQPTNGTLEAECDMLAQLGYIAHGAVLVKDGEYLVQLMTVFTLAFPAGVIAGLSPYGQGLIGQADAVSARTYLGAGTSNLVLGEVAGTAKEGNYQPEVADISDATATGMALFKAATALEARNVIGAGTSNLVLGMVAGTAKSGDYQPYSYNIQDSTSIGQMLITSPTDTAARLVIGAGTGNSNLVLGTTAGTAKEGNYQPASTDITDSTAVGRSVLTASTQANARTAIGAGTSNLVIGTTVGTAKDGAYQPTAANISDSTATGRAVLTAVDATAARTAIGAGTSSLVIGTTAGTAKVGNYQPASTDISDSTTVGRAVLTAATQAAGRTAIGAGTSNLVIGTTVGTAKDGAYQPASTDITDSTALGRQLITVANTAALKALVPYLNQVFRATYATTGATISQTCAADNTMQSIIFNTQPLPNATLGTLNNATGVFTVATTFSGIVSIVGQYQRTTGLLINTVFVTQMETSPDGVTWTPLSGSAKRMMLTPTDNGIMHTFDITVATTWTAGTQVRFRMATDVATTTTGLFATNTGNGATYGNGFSLSIYSVL